MSGTSPDPRAFWRALLYRWFVEYNPAYLLSAAFVFGGCFLWSRGVVNDATLTCTLGIPFVAELYAVALIGGAALLTRLDQRRPAVMLALVFVAYQWDTTLHTEACAYLGNVGAWASIAWLALFFGKLWAIGWALRIRIDRGMIVAFVLGAVGLVVLPRVLPLIGPRAAGSVLAAWVFAFLSLHHGGSITSKDELDAWRSIVLRRATHAAWGISVTMIALHVFMWCSNTDVSLAPLFFAAQLLAVQRIRSEIVTWAVVVAALAFGFMGSPGTFFVTSTLVSGALLLRIFAPRFLPVPSMQQATPEEVAVPYRASNAPRAFVHPRIEHVPAAPLTASEITRAWSGAIFAAYLGAWTASWSEGAWPAHVLWLDVVLVLAMAVAMWRLHARVVFAVPLAATWIHFASRSHLVPLPRTSTGWGELGIAIGFALLGVSLSVSYRLRGFAPTKPPVDTA